MDPVNSLNNIIKTLRQRLHNQDATKLKNKKTTTSNKAEKKDKISLQELKINTINKAKAVDPENKNPQLKTQILLESILIWEFGEELINDPQFEPMRRDIQDAIASDPSLVEKLNSLLKN